MAKSCCLCGKNLGLMGGFPVTNDTSLVFCDICDEKSREMLNSAGNNENKYREARAYFENYLNTYQYPDQIKKAIIEKIDRSENTRQININNRLQQNLIQEAITNMMTTTGYNFEGYKIIKYFKIVTSEVVLGTGFLSSLNAGFADFTGGESDAYAAKLDLARNTAMDKLIKKVVDMQANAIIGVDIDYINFRSDLIGVIVNGTAVTIEKII